MIRLRIACICLMTVALCAPAAFSSGAIEVYPTCTGATPSEADVPTETSFFVETNDFDLSGCNNQMDAGFDVVSCFEVDAVEDNCVLNIAAEMIGCTDALDPEGNCESTIIGVAGYAGTCSSSPGPCGSDVGEGSAVIEPLLSDGDMFCVVVASGNTQALHNLRISQEVGECRLVPVELQSFEVSR